VKGITIDEQDAVVSLETINKEATLLTVSARGYGKRSDVDGYRLQSRGGKGVITMRTTEKTGEVVSMRQVNDDDHLMLVTDTGRIIRLRMAELRVIGRNTQGVRLLNTGPEERVVSLALLAEKEDEVAAEEVVVSVEEDIISTEEDI
jgi:DNA gyrase subunit A